jgi:hypothetical protein
VPVPAWIEFTGAAQVAQVRRTVTKKGKKTVERLSNLITSDRMADPATLAAWIRGHWAIENKLHWSATSPTRKTLGRHRSKAQRPRRRSYGNRLKLVARPRAVPAGAAARRGPRGRRLHLSLRAYL